MYRITGVIEGVAPLLFNRPDPETLEAPNPGKRSAAQRLKEAEARIYKNGHGVFLPKHNFKKCLLDGSGKAGMKVGMKSLAQFLDASVFVEDDLLFGQDSYDFMHAVPGRVPPRTGAMVMIRRPAMQTGWQLPFALQVVDDRRVPEQIRMALDEAGMLAGLGSWRPEYGRFIVTEWNVET
jgi:hypothetical protein